MSRHPLMKWAKLALILLAAVGLCEAVQADMEHHELRTNTPIKHLASTYPENFSIDHDQVFPDPDDRLSRMSLIRNRIIH